MTKDQRSVLSIKTTPFSATDQTKPGLINLVQGLPLGLGLCQALRSKANRALPALDSNSRVQSKSDPSLVGLGLPGPKQIGLFLGLGPQSPKQIGLSLGLGLPGPRPDRTPKSAPGSGSGLDSDSVRFVGFSASAAAAPQA
jgi:hypothetical protein